MIGACSHDRHERSKAAIAGDCPLCLGAVAKAAANIITNFESDGYRYTEGSAFYQDLSILGAALDAAAPGWRERR